ncbi:hypothetical protein PG999_007411 [Apiospora kogelbergensis]|uniref:Myb-like DNA-binding domain-containing protein n=1 Tax=Apiospora kogelbergensis TaxID=1337665 RepID=A0AAW0QY90_9PEZI
MVEQLSGGTVKGPWTPEEDRRLCEAVAKYKTNWVKIAAFVGSRCGDQCSSHWRQALNPSINYCDWTKEEDEQLLQAVRHHGTNWSTIATFHTPERTTLALKNRYWKLRALLTKSREQAATQSRSSADDESEDDDAEEDDDDDVEEEVIGVHPDPYVQSVGKCSDRTSRPALCYPSDPVKFPHAWNEPAHGKNAAQSETQSPLVTPKSWLGGLVDDQPLEDGGGTQLYCHGDMFDITSSNGEAMSLDFGMLDGTMAIGAEPAHAGNALGEALERSGPDSPKLGPITPQSMSNKSEPMPIDPDLEKIGTGPGLRQVSISLACTTGELSHVMSLIAGTGLNLSIKIDSSHR